MDSESLGKVAVVLGGSSGEREVSLMSGSGVYDALIAEGVQAVKFDPKEQSVKELLDGKFDRAFLILHGKGGEDGVIQGMMEYIGLPYTGSGVQASAIGMDKVATKTIWSASGIPVPKGMVLRGEKDCKEALECLGSDLVIKPSKEGSSIGIYKLKNASVESVQEAFKKAQENGMDVMVEEWVKGRELTVAVLDRGDGKGPEALPVIEIKAPEGDYDFEHKYYSNETRYFCPAELDEKVAEKIRKTAKQAFDALDACGWGRIDVMLREDGTFALLEINTAPGMTPHSLVPLAAKACGISYNELVKIIAAGAALKG